MNPARMVRSPEFLNNFIYEAIVWTLAGAFFALLRSNADEQSLYGDISAFNLLLFIGPMGLLAAIIFGLINTYIDRRIVYNKPFRYLIIISLLVYTSGFILFIIINFFRLCGITDHSPTLSHFYTYITDFNSVVFIVYMLVVSFIFTLFRQIDKKMGRGNLWRMIRGEYYEPKEVQRTFMFMDLRSSTTIAEKLGNIQYSKFLRDCFNELARVACYHAEVYQFVGDEVVLTWPVKSKNFKMDVIKTFVAYNATLNARSDYFMSTYGVVPEFKAGVHSGTVTLTEVGQVKREMAYHGDTINTAARLEAECNGLQVNILVSKAALDALTLNDYTGLRPLGLVKLRGRVEEIEVFTI
ncbi:adenylate cyclase Cya2 [soil metagenome]